MINKTHSRHSFKSENILLDKPLFNKEKLTKKQNELVENKRTSIKTIKEFPSTKSNLYKSEMSVKEKQEHVEEEDIFYDFGNILLF